MSNSINNDPLKTLESAIEVQHALHGSTFIYKEAKEKALVDSDQLPTLASGGFLDPSLLDMMTIETNRDVHLLSLPQPNAKQRMPKIPRVEIDRFSNEFLANLTSIKQYPNFNFDAQHFIKAFLNKDEKTTTKFINTYNAILEGTPIKVDGQNVVISNNP